MPETMAEQMLTFAFFITLFAGTIAFGVVYNSARISLSERSRELASLRVLGFTRGEISSILLGELAVLTVAAIPIGLVMGYGFAGFMVMVFDTEQNRRRWVASKEHAVAWPRASGMAQKYAWRGYDLVASQEMKR